MKKVKGLYIILLMLILVMPACNISINGAEPAPAASNPEGPNLALTITAQASLLESGAQQPNVQPPPQAQDTPLSEPQATFTPEPTSTPESTTTPSVATVTVSVNTNCRTGPGTQYDAIDALTVGQTAEVVGKNTSTNYWIIKRPGGSGTCWLWGQHATVSGNTSNLQEVAVPTIAAPPAAPSNVKLNNTSCAFDGAVYKVEGTLTWQDNSTNEKGFMVWDSDGNLLGTLAANSTSHKFVTYTGNSTIGIGVEAFNDVGESKYVQAQISCP